LLLGFVPAHGAVLVPGGFVNDTLVMGLDAPTSMAFLPDGRLLFTEQRTGFVRLIVNGHVAASDPVLAIPDVNPTGLERGLQGVAVDPGWPARPYVYLSYTRDGGTCRIVRYRASGDLDDPAGESLALGDSLVLMDDIPDQAAVHNVGCLRFGPGNYLYAGTGDDFDPCMSADSTSLLGAILRLDVSRLPEGPGGQVPRALITPAMNPLSTADTNARLVWAYGFRNPWRFGIDAPTGAIYTADVGTDQYEEVDEVLPGDFLGWPFREGPYVVQPGGCSEVGGPGANAYKGPIVSYAHVADLTALSCAGMYRPAPGGSANWPPNYYGFTYGDVFYGEYFSGFLRRLKKVSGVWITPPAVFGQPNSEDWATGLVSGVEFLVGPDGSLWWLAQFDSTLGGTTGSLQRIRFVGLPVGVEDAREAASADGAPGAAPNPFRSATRVSFRLPAREQVALAVHDLAGRRVRRLFEGEAPAGQSTIEWDGRDDGGAPAGPGLYFVRLRRARDGVTHAARVLRLR
jgi:glucose/arabinose dehydrogenase